MSSTSSLEQNKRGISFDILCLFSDMMSGSVYYTVIDEYHLYVFWMTVANFQFTYDRWTKKQQMSITMCRSLFHLRPVSLIAPIYRFKLPLPSRNRPFLATGFYQNKKLTLKSFLFPFIFKWTKRTLGLKGNICFYIVIIFYYSFKSNILCFS